MLKKICGAMERAESFLIAILLLIMTALAVLQVLTRALSITLIWMEEATRYCMIWLCFIGMPLAVRRHAHISIDMIPELMRGKFGMRHYDIFINLLVVVFCGFCLFYSWKLTSAAIVTNQLTTGLKIPRWTMYLSMCIGSLLSIFHAVAESWFALKGEEIECC